MAQSHKSRGWGRASNPRRRTCVVRPSPFPSPQLSPLGRGESYSVRDQPEPASFHAARATGLPLLGERAGVRGNGSCPKPTRRTTAGTVKLQESSGRAKPVENQPGRHRKRCQERHGQQVAHTFTVGSCTAIWFFAAFDGRVTGPQPTGRSILAFRDCRGPACLWGANRVFGILATLSRINGLTANLRS